MTLQRFNGLTLYHQNLRMPFYSCSTNEECTVKKPLFFIAGLCMGSAATFIVLQNSDSLEKPLIQHASAFPVLEKEGFTIAYDPRFKIPYWTHEKITKESLKGSADRKMARFTEDPAIHKPHRSVLNDFKGSKLDRGHLSPAANHKRSLKALNDTFYLSNICPQDPALNRGWWKKLEKHVRVLTASYESVEVITGPLFLAKNTSKGRFVKFKVIGSNDVAVPTHFFKVIKATSPNQQITQCFVAPNQPFPTETPIEAMERPLEFVEKRSGIPLLSSTNEE